MRDQIDILGVKVDVVTMEQATQQTLHFMDEEGTHLVFTPNSEIIYAAYKDEELAKILNGADLLTPDGIGVVHASKMLNKPLAERVAGCDLICHVMQRMAQSGKSVFLFGAKPGVAEEAAEILRERYPGLVIAGTRNGYFTEQENDEIIAQINDAKPDLLLVCLGAPKEEFWIGRHAQQLEAKVVVGAGGSLDVIAGRVERAPEKWQKLGLEWLYRLKKEPWRIGRMMALPIFALTVLFRGKRYKSKKEDIV